MMSGVDIQEVWAGDILLAFDGRVLEVFGFPGSESLRFHVRNLELAIEEGRDGRHTVLAKPAMRGGGCRFDVEAGDWAAVEPLLEAVLAAMPEE